MSKKPRKSAKSKDYVEYDSNNSGGHWWLEDKDWFALEKAGWKVNWVKNSEHHQRYRDKPVDRFLGALATGATRYGVASMQEAVEEWERVTGRSSTAAGCPCCGPPHSFTFYKNGEWAGSGPYTSYEASW